MKDMSNAILGRAWIGIEDHGCLTCVLQLNGDGSTQGFGGRRLDGSGDNYAGPKIRALLDALEVDSWDRVKGQAVRVRRDAGGMITAIGHIVKDRWFSW